MSVKVKSDDGQNGRVSYFFILLASSIFKVLIKLLSNRKPRSDSPFENTLQHEKPQHAQTSPTARKASQCTGFHTARVSTKRWLRRDISVVIIPTLLFRLYCWFGVRLWCHNSLSCILYYVYICLQFRYVCLTCHLLCGVLLLIFGISLWYWGAFGMFSLFLY